MGFQVVLVEPADGMDVECLPGCLEDLVFGAAIVVSGSDDDGHFGTSLAQGCDGLVEQLLDGGFGVGSVIHIARDEKQVGLSLFRDLDHLVKHGFLFFGAVKAIEHIAQVPVAGMEDFHGFACFVTG